MTKTNNYKTTRLELKVKGTFWQSNKGEMTYALPADTKELTFSQINKIAGDFGFIEHAWIIKTETEVNEKVEKNRIF
jgi:hypothetical protein